MTTTQTQQFWADMPITEQIDHLHAAYCQAMNLAVRLLPAYERWWYNAAKQGMHPNDVIIVIADRKRKTQTKERNVASLLLRNICGSDEAIGDVINEANAIRAAKRKPCHCKGKQEVLHATGRPVEIEQGNAVHISEVFARIGKEKS